MDKTPTQEKKPVLTLVKPSTLDDRPFIGLICGGARYTAIQLVRNYGSPVEPNASAGTPAPPTTSQP